MNLLKLSIYSLLCSSIISLSNTKAKSIQSNNFNEQNDTSSKSLCESNNDFYGDFSFKESTICKTNILNCTLSDNFDGVATLTFKGNIKVLSHSSILNNHSLVLLLPDNENGNLEILLTYNNQSFRKNIYSVKKSNSEYAISSLSLYSALLLTSKVDGQQYMDNDKITVNDQGQTPDFRIDSKSNPSKVIAFGKVAGYIKWSDDEGNIHPLTNAKVKITLSGSWGGGSTYTNSDGYYIINFSNQWTLSSFSADIHIYAENNMVKIINESNKVYEKAERLTGMKNKDNYIYNYTFNSSDLDLNHAMNVFSAMSSFSNYAMTLNNNVTIPQCKVIYPSEEKGSYYSNGENTITLGNESQSKAGAPSVHQSWDVIGHEYGHHLQKQYFSHDYFGSHYSKESNILNNLENNNGTSDIAKTKKEALGLAWKESWPTFFSIVAQRSFLSDFKTIKTVGDDCYTAYNNADYSLNDTDIKKGEGCERTIMSFLYQLWDNESNDFDNISISDSNLWAIMKGNNPEFFYSFISSLYNSGIDYSKADLGKLLEFFKFSASNITISIDDSNYDNKPTFYWQKNGYDVIYNNTTYNFSNDKFDLIFLDSDENIVAKKENISGSSVELSLREWNDILVGKGNFYYVILQAYDTLGITSGPYYSNFYKFNKPTSNATANVTLNDFRYYEKAVTILPSSYYYFNVTFKNSGTKLIQTFSKTPTDTMLWLYDSDGSTLIESDDIDGYNYNSLIYRYLYANHKYVIKLGIYNQNNRAKVKLSIAPIYGASATNADAMSKFEGFINLEGSTNYTFNSYLAQYYSKMIKWKPKDSGKYTISLNSEFDNYLYVIDPELPDENVKDLNYNDDSDGRNAKITSTFEKDKTYVIMYSQFNPANSFDNVDNHIDVKITKK